MAESFTRSSNGLDYRRNLDSVKDCQNRSLYWGMGGKLVTIEVKKGENVKQRIKQRWGVVVNTAGDCFRTNRGWIDPG